MVLGQTHVNGWSHIFISQNEGSTDYISPLRLRVLHWSHRFFNYWKNKKTIIKKFIFLLFEIEFTLIIGKLHDFGPRYNLR